jgi:hypothetical protein
MNKTPLPPPKASNEQIRSYVAAARRGQQSQHVVPSEGGWSVKRAGASRASRVFRTKSEAVSYGRAVARSNNVELVVHSMDGRVGAVL